MGGAESDKNEGQRFQVANPHCSEWNVDNLPQPTATSLRIHRTDLIKVDSKVVQQLCPRHFATVYLARIAWKFVFWATEINRTPVQIKYLLLIGFTAITLLPSHKYTDRILPSNFFQPATKHQLVIAQPMISPPIGSESAEMFYYPANGIVIS